MTQYKNWKPPSYSNKAITLLACVLALLWILVSLRFQPEGDVEIPDVEEPYLRAVRLLGYQLLHNPRTCSGSNDIPFLVLVTPDVSEGQRQILMNGGAIVLPVESLGRDWIHPKWGRWSNVLAKPNLWRLDEYDKITFLDADSTLLSPIHEIFEQRTTNIRQPTMPNPDEPVNCAIAEGLPSEYMTAGIRDAWMEQFMPPPDDLVFYQKGSYMNAGFFVLHPSKAIFDYYNALLDIPEQFDSGTPSRISSTAHTGRMAPCHGSTSARDGTRRGHVRRI
ncbi:nucleotide-diphospho-sugar transferase [Penicillium sp. IBT 35674x]|nr:nucleotide-diphospho-sugar transferase [Penicillium sp. IBT 35674x]